jgi:hypothetical protein
MLIAVEQYADASENMMTDVNKKKLLSLVLSICNGNFFNKKISSP